MKFNKGTINYYNVHPMVIWRPILNNHQKQQIYKKKIIIPLVIIYKYTLIIFSSLCNYTNFIMHIHWKPSATFYSFSHYPVCLLKFPLYSLIYNNISTKSCYNDFLYKKGKKIKSTLLNSLNHLLLSSFRLLEIQYTKFIDERYFYK